MSASSRPRSEAAPYAASPISYDPGRAPGKISARILGFSQGLIAFDGARLVRVVSDDHTLLIMEDFAPVLGEVRGSVTVLTDEGEHRFEVKRGYYLHSHNEFSLVICEEFTPRVPAVAVDDFVDDDLPFDGGGGVGGRHG